MWTHSKRRKTSIPPKPTPIGHYILETTSHRNSPKLTPSDVGQGESMNSANIIEENNNFWNKFQPGRWYHSIYYLTNTG